MTEPQLRIGPFSRASSLSVKALRAYHEQGLLVPAEVDPDTGYRVYAASQLLDAAVLARLRALDVPLKEIGEVLAARDPAVTERVLAAHAARMQDRLDETVRIVAELQQGIDTPELHTPVHLREVPAQHALLRAGHIDADGFGPFLGESFGLIDQVAAEAGATPSDVHGMLCAQRIEADDGEDVVAFLPLVEPVAVPAGVDVRMGEVPATTVAVAVHAGGYGQIGDTYRQLGRWVAAHAVPADLDVRERYLVGPPAPEPDFRTEIHWPVA